MQCPALVTHSPLHCLTVRRISCWAEKMPWWQQCGEKIHNLCSVTVYNNFALTPNYSYYSGLQMLIFHDTAFRTSASTTSCCGEPSLRDENDQDKHFCGPKQGKAASNQDALGQGSTAVAAAAAVCMYRVRQQKPDAQNFNSKKTFRNRFKTHK